MAVKVQGFRQVICLNFRVDPRENFPSVSTPQSLVLDHVGAQHAVRLAGLGYPPPCTHRYREPAGHGLCSWQRGVGYLACLAPAQFVTAAWLVGLAGTCLKKGRLERQRDHHIRQRIGHAGQDETLALFIRAQAWPFDVIDHLAAG